MANRLDAVRKAMVIDEDENNFSITIKIKYAKKTGFINVGSPGCEKANPIGHNIPIMWRVAGTIRFVVQIVEEFFCLVERKLIKRGKQAA